MRIKALYTVTALALALAAAAYGTLHRTGHGPEAGLRHHAALSAAHILHVSGRVRGLYPGARKGFRVKLYNRSRRWVVVPAIRAHVLGGAAGASPANLSTPPKHLDYPRVRPHNTRRIGIRIRMWPRAPDACQGVRFPLRFEVRARFSRRHHHHRRRR